MIDNNDARWKPEGMELILTVL